MRKTARVSLSISLFLFSSFANATSGPIDLPMTQSSFQQVLDQLNEKIKPIVLEKYNKVYLATGDWTKPYSETSSGGSFYHPTIPGVDYENTWGVHIVGWLAKWPGFGTDTMEFTLCHELGHHLFGGASEIEADNFAPSCLGWVWPDADNIVWFNRNKGNNSQDSQGLCDASANESERAFCLRVLNTLPVLENFREWFWRKLGIQESKIKPGSLCRRKAIVSGVFHRQPPECEFYFLEARIPIPQKILGHQFERPLAQTQNLFRRR